MRREASGARQGVRRPVVVLRMTGTTRTSSPSPLATRLFM